MPREKCAKINKMRKEIYVNDVEKALKKKIYQESKEVKLKKQQIEKEEKTSPATKVLTCHTSKKEPNGNIVVSDMQCKFCTKK